MKQKIASLGKALLIFHSPNDKTVSIDNAAYLFQTAKHPKSFISLDRATVKTWGNLSQAFLEQYSFNLDLIPKHEDLVALQQKPHESFGVCRSLAYLSLPGQR